MEAATSFLHSNPMLQFSNKPSYYTRKKGLITKNCSIKSKAGEGNGDSRDENMLVLRIRIKKRKVLESINNNGNNNNNSNSSEVTSQSSDWTVWEKKVFVKYHQGAFDSADHLQSYLLNTRPSLALAMVALVAMSIPFSTSTIAVHALKLAKGLLDGCHVCIDIDF